MKKTRELLRRERMEIKLSILLEQFVATKRVEGCSAKTVSWYENMLGRFLRFVGDVTIAEFGLDLARRFIASLQNQEQRYEEHPFSKPKDGGLSPHTISCYARSLKTFSRWLMDEGYTKHDVLARLKKPRLSQPMIEVLTNEEISDLLASINPNTFLGARLYAVVLLLLDTGLRASEVCSFTLDNTDLTNGTVKVVGKGRKERIVPFGAGTKKALLRYLTTFRPESISNQFFLSVDGEALSYNALKMMIQRLGKRAGVGRVHLHLFRHTFAVRYLTNGGDVMTLRLILGHTTLAVTQQYLHLADQHIRIAHSRYSPVDRLGITSGRSGIRMARGR